MTPLHMVIFFNPLWLLQPIKKFTSLIKAIAFLNKRRVFFFCFVIESKFVVLEYVSFIIWPYFILALGLLVLDFWFPIIILLTLQICETGLELFHHPFCFGCLTDSTFFSPTFLSFCYWFASVKQQTDIRLMPEFTGVRTGQLVVKCTENIELMCELCEIKRIEWVLLLYLRGEGALAVVWST